MICNRTKSKVLVKVLAKALQDPDSGVRCSAAQALGKIGGSEAASLLGTLYPSEDKDFNSSAIRSLGQIGDAEYVDVLMKALGDIEGIVREEAAKALSKFDNPETREALAKALSDRESRVRISAAKALARIIASQMFSNIDSLALFLFIAQALNSQIIRSFSLRTGFS